MMTSNNIIDVSEADFEYEVVIYSQETLVVVDFWAEWCVPCKLLSPLLERLAKESHGIFRLAKLNIDQNPKLAQRFRVTSIPAVKAFRGGTVVSEFSGVQPEPRVREFIRALIPTPADLDIEKGFSMLTLRRPSEAEQAFRSSLTANPGKPEAMLGLAKSLLIQGKGTEGLKILSDFPTSRQYNAAQSLLPLAQQLVKIEKAEALPAPEDVHDPAFENALRLIRRGNLEAAMDGLLDILRENRRYRNELARQVLVGLLETLGDDSPLAAEYRRELTQLLF